MSDRVREIMEDMEARGIDPSVRKVRDALGGGSFTDVGEAIRTVKAARERVRAAQSDLPQCLKDKLSILALDLWLAAQERADRVIDDVRKGCEARVGAADVQAADTLREVDEAERRIEELSRALERKQEECADLEKSAATAAQRATTAEARAAALEAEIRAMSSHAKSRERELTNAFASIERMTSLLAGGRTAAPARKPNGKDKSTSAPADEKPADPAE
jgi:chromosome segregation ATPase